ncbi:MAG: TonB-dependent receptor, partial [Deltaproteobacteria bacterium]|nr:TonB-dependent receptor [Deltaproteobacteria bacterium]
AEPDQTPENDETLGDPFDPRLRLDLPGLEFRPRDVSTAAPSLLGVDARRIVATIAGVRVSSILAGARDDSFWSHLASGALHLGPWVGPDAAALRGDALGGTIDLAAPEPPDDPYRPTAFALGGRLGWAGDTGGLAGHLRAGVQVADLRLAAVLAGAAPGLTDGLAADDTRMGEALAGDALFDLRASLGEDDALRVVLRLDGSSGLVRGPENLGRGFLRVDDARDTLLAVLWRHGDPGPGSVTAWALARTSERALLAFDPPADRWSRSDETLWTVAGGASASFAERWWSVGLAGELRAEGVSAALSRGFSAGGDTWGDLMGDWPYRPLLDGTSRAGGALALDAGFRLGDDVRLRAAISVFLYRLFLPEDPFGQQEPDRYATTESWEVEPAADLGVTWEIGSGLKLDARFESGARPADAEQLAAAGLQPGAELRWMPAYGLEPERSYGGQLGLRFEAGIVDLRLAYHVQWIDGAVTAGPLGEPADGELPATWRNTEELVQGAALSGTVYLHGDWPLRFVIESSHGWLDDGWGGEYRPLEVAPLSFLIEIAFRPPEGEIEAGIYGGYRWRPESWETSPVEARLAASCVLDAVSCVDRETIPVGAYLRWTFWRGLAMVARAGGMSFQGDGPSVQGFLTAAF